MGVIQIIGYALQIILWVLDAIKENRDEIKKQKTDAIQSGVRGVIDGDAPRIVASFDRLRSLK